MLTQTTTKKKKQKFCAPSDITAQTLISPIIVIIVVAIVILRLFSYIIPLCVHVSLSVCVFFISLPKKRIHCTLDLFSVLVQLFDDIDAGSISTVYSFLANTKSIFWLTWFFSFGSKVNRYWTIQNRLILNNATAYIIE